MFGRASAIYEGQRADIGGSAAALRDAPSCDDLLHRTCVFTMAGLGNTAPCPLVKPRPAKSNGPFGRPSQESRAAVLPGPVARDQIRSKLLMADAEDKKAQGGQTLTDHLYG